MKAIVCDCSVTAAWCLQDESSEAAESLLRDGYAEILVPALWPAEMANVLWAAGRRGRISAADAEAALAALERLPIRIQPPVPVRELLALARTHEMTAYDAAYLALAARAGVALASFDEQLAARADRAGVSLAL